MMETRTYLTGGLGSRHRDEAFGDPFELPPDQAYAETCASIASVMLAWRLLLATGDPDLRRRHRTDRLQRRAAGAVARWHGLLLRQRPAAPDRPGRRGRAFRDAQAVVRVRLLPTERDAVPELLAAVPRDDGRDAVSRSTSSRPARSGAELAGGPIRISTATGYPWDGAVTVTILETPPEPWTLSLRIPAWCTSATLRNGARRHGGGPGRCPSRGRDARAWQAGDALTLELDLPVRATEPDRRVDAVRGCVALERGPLVYCIETADLPSGVSARGRRAGPVGPDGRGRPARPVSDRPSG